MLFRQPDRRHGSFGLYEIDGDGVPELVTLSNRTLTISKIEPALQNDGTFVPATSGRLRMIDNGYGAFTTINYCSAKKDASTDHSLPYPEIVVCSIGSILTSDPSHSLASTQYAYGSAEPRHFDAACDCWVFRGYERRVSLQNTGDPANSRPWQGYDQRRLRTRSIPTQQCGLERNGPIPAVCQSRPHQRCDKVIGEFGTDPWALLAAPRSEPIRAASRPLISNIIRQTARLLPAGRTGNEFCVDMLDPYNYDTSLAYNNDSTHGGQDQCAQRGFVLPKSVISYRGTPGIEEGNAASIITHQIVRTASFTTAFDDFGRVTDRTIIGDMADPTTFSCVQSITLYRRP